MLLSVSDRLPRCPCVFCPWVVSVRRAPLFLCVFVREVTVSVMNPESVNCSQSVLLLLLQLQLFNLCVVSLLRGLSGGQWAVFSPLTETRFGLYLCLYSFICLHFLFTHCAEFHTLTVGSHLDLVLNEFTMRLCTSQPWDEDVSVWSSLKLQLFTRCC